MKKVIASVAGLVMVASAPAWGQAKNFEGWALGASLNALSSSWEYSSSPVQSSSASDVSASLQLQYNFVPMDTLVLGLGLDAGLSSAKAGNFASGQEVQFKNQSSLYTIVGVPTSPNSMLFAKLSSNNMTVAAGISKDVSGYGFGLSFQSNLSKTLYWQLGYDWVNFNEVQDSSGAALKPKYGALRMGVGYRF